MENLRRMRTSPYSWLTTRYCSLAIGICLTLLRHSILNASLESGASNLWLLTRKRFLAASLTQKGFVIGDGGEENIGNVTSVRKEFRTLAFWQGHLKTDDAGERFVRVHCPRQPDDLSGRCGGRDQERANSEATRARR